MGLYVSVPPFRHLQGVYQKQRALGLNAKERKEWRKLRVESFLQGFFFISGRPATLEASKEICRSFLIDAWSARLPFSWAGRLPWGPSCPLLRWLAFRTFCSLAS